MYYVWSINGAYYYRFWMNMIILHHWNNCLYTQILTLICLVHVTNERACIGTACCFVLFTYSCEKNMIKTMHVSKTVEHCWICWICLPLRNRLFPRICPCILFHVSALLLFFLFFFCIRICINVLDILTFQDRFLYLYKIKIR
jgi:hypothetical protein